MQAHPRWGEHLGEMLAAYVSRHVPLGCFCRTPILHSALTGLLEQAQHMPAGLQPC